VLPPPAQTGRGRRGPRRNMVELKLLISARRSMSLVGFPAGHEYALTLAAIDAHLVAVGLDPAQISLRGGASNV
jgi:hypothetical protein